MPKTEALGFPVENTTQPQHLTESWIFTFKESKNSSLY